jgi:hypothetical protein
MTISLILGRQYVHYGPGGTSGPWTITARASGWRRTWERPSSASPPPKLTPSFARTETSPTTTGDRPAGRGSHGTSASRPAARRHRDRRTGMTTALTHRNSYGGSTT